ncbi:MAG: hypothetical protein E5Y81_07390 [Mesorhizobium sp.]|uniref:hypothetical protein n=2 Tax=Mesorhizobium sp. TaxID=1871066 RepID=UPI001213C2B0|nr:hypothetical protein [Mesorhizobium sp.]TIL80201.1 MAG: hypothetical protein E5Y81_07390 [Mesorhizobium sp.]
MNGLTIGGQALIDRHGSDHGSMHQDLVGLFGCSKCKAEGRDCRPVFFTFIPDDKGQQRERNRTWKPTFESEGLKTREPFIREPLCVHVPSRATTHIAKG